ncbi:MAG: hypothetical protein KA108_06650 [Candidatus Fermentibacter sp.]|nr:hypothetical protein [Candidatus Fermentibacter sp.]MCC6871573.1 hypothetical protein [Candidatus Fermentibacter sp.]NLI01711.1 hypothetical protein [Candidatus Fermentibacter daniensis]
MPTAALTRSKPAAILTDSRLVAASIPGQTIQARPGASVASGSLSTSPGR